MNYCNSIIWLRRELRIYDNTSFASAINQDKTILPIFIFDEEILARFKGKEDRRLSFIADTLIMLNKDLKKYSSKVLILHGKSIEIVPKISHILKVESVFASMDYEPTSIERDQKIETDLSDHDIDFILEEDQVLVPINNILKKDKSPYKVYTPYKKVWRQKINMADYSERKVNLSKAKWADVQTIEKILVDSNIKVVDSVDAESILKVIGYGHVTLPRYFQVNNCRNKLKNFAKDKLASYEINRNFMGYDGTSSLSPFIRFGLLSIRDCYRTVTNKTGADSWINELIWRDFYKMIIYHYPYSSDNEFQKKYQKAINWENDQNKFNAWKEGKTGYPLVDAAMRQLKSIGWMHNRMRMITASFLSKHLLTDWRLGEEHFAQYLMDYDLSSNVGGWQWSASTGNDAQPYFRVFNPNEQAKKFDPEGIYIKKYLPELKNVPIKYLLTPKIYKKSINYPDPIVDHKTARDKAIKAFRRAKNGCE